jgi:hypothetical protein
LIGELSAISLTSSVLVVFVFAQVDLVDLDLFLFALILVQLSPIVRIIAYMSAAAAVTELKS